MHYKTIKFNIKIPQTKHTQFSFLRRASREKLDIATLRAKRAEIFYPPPPPIPKNGSMPLLAPPDEVCQVRHCN